MLFINKVNCFGLNYDHYWNIDNYRNNHEHEHTLLLNRKQVQTPFARYLADNKHEKCLARADAECTFIIDSCVFHIQQHYALSERDHILQLHVINYHGSPDRIVWNVMGSLPPNTDLGGAVTEQKIECCSPIEVTMEPDDELILVHSLNIKLLNSTSINISHGDNCMSD